MTHTMKQMGRLAMRHEGRFWVAYYALPNTMEGALLLGSIAMAGVEDNLERKDAFMEIMKGLVSDILEERIGTRPEWPDPPHPAPESERSGNA